MMRPVTVQVSGLGEWWDSDQPANYVEQSQAEQQQVAAQAAAANASSSGSSSSGFSVDNLITTGGNLLNTVLTNVFGQNNQKPSAQTQVVTTPNTNTGLTAAQQQQLLLLQQQQAAQKTNYTPYIIGGGLLVGALMLVLVLKK